MEKHFEIPCNIECDLFNFPAIPYFPVIVPWTFIPVNKIVNIKSFA
jgi:hypothetical protein